MTAISPPPIDEPVVDENRVSTLPWVLFFNQLFTGDTGTSWDPTWTGLTTVGTPTYNSTYYRIGPIVYFRVQIIAGTNTSATAGTTYINNFPLDFRADGAVFVVNNNLGTGSGHVVSANNRIYVPGWTTVSTPLTVVGFAEGG